MTNRAPQHSAAPSRRGLAAISVLIVLLLGNLVLMGMVLTGTRDQDLSIRRLETIRAIYAAEAGINMAVREIALSLDVDGDGGIGSISDDANPANDPTIGLATVTVTITNVTSQSTLESTGVSGQARRRFQVVLDN